MILFKKIKFKNFGSFGNNWTEIDLNKKTTPLDFINYLRAKSFGSTTNAFFVDPSSKKRFYVNINIEEVV